MKVLFITTRIPDWFPDAIYIGLRALKVDLAEYPYKPMHHCSLKNGLIVARDENGEIVAKENPKDGRVHFSKSFDVIRTTSKSQCYVDKKKPGPAADIDNLDAYDNIIISALHWDMVNTLGTLTKKADGRFCFVDGEDDPFIRGIYFHSQHYFKREKLKHNEFFGSFWRPLSHAKHFAWTNLAHDASNIPPYLKNLGICAPLPQTRLVFHDNKLLSLNGTQGSGKSVPTKKSHNKYYDVCMILNSKTNPSRERFASYLRLFCSRNRLKYYIRTDGDLAWNKYISIMQNSKCCISLPGLGYDTVRYWEIPSYGSVLVSPRLPIEINNNFKDMDSAVFFSSKQEFESKILTVLKRNLWAEMGMNAKRHFEKYHTPVNRAQRVLDSFDRR